MRDFGTCGQTTSNRIITFEQRRSKIIFYNETRNRLQKVDVECLKLKGRSCDGLLIEQENLSIEHFIELKGNKVFEGIEQIENTILQISADSKNLPKHAYISSTKSPHTDPTIEKIKKKLRANYNLRLIIKTGHLTIHL